MTGLFRHFKRCVVSYPCINCFNRWSHQNLVLSRRNRAWPAPSKRFGSSLLHKPPLLYEDVTNEDMARALVLQLKPKGRELVLLQIQKLDTEENADTEMKKMKLNPDQIKNLWLFNALPFVGFGFLDNFIMIVAGEYIDVKLGAILSISTMAAAALGNLVSDVAGIGLSGYVEVLVCKIGVEIPRLSSEQMTSWQVRWIQALSRVLGISIGCLIGMLPLLFLSKKDSDDGKKI